MTFSPDTLEKMTEAHLLKAVLLNLEIDNPDVEGKKALVSMIRVSMSAIYNWEAGRGSMGIERWMEIQRVTGYGFIQSWMDHKINQHKEKSK